MLLSDVHEALGRILVLLFNGSRDGIYRSVVSFLRSTLGNSLTLGQRYPVCMVRFIGILWSCLDLNCDPSSPTIQYLKRFILTILLVVQPSVLNATPNYPLHQALTRKETFGRLHSLFGVGWFFEWPGGRHPLNSTWPWADVKPSLLVLWGVCWMFVMALPISMSRSSSQPSSLSYRPRVFPTHKRSYCYCYGPTQRHEHHHYCKPCTLLSPSLPLLFIWSGCRVSQLDTSNGVVLTSADRLRKLSLASRNPEHVVHLAKDFCRGSARVSEIASVIEGCLEQGRLHPHSMPEQSVTMEAPSMMR